MADNLFEIRNKPDNQEVYEHIFYTIFGDHEELNDKGDPVVSSQEKALAYSRISSKNKQFYIKVGLYGKIYNPIGLYSEGKSNKFLSKVGKQEYNFVKVNNKVFDMYLQFLKTKNIAWLNNAEREMS